MPETLENLPPFISKKDPSARPTSYENQNLGFMKESMKSPEDVEVS